ncbi:Predicted choloylglycine hydrolase [Franzmannia pantelleriensis]|uniref:Predicted choloylglycine hydrolase n=1 Tax=Franzmannia pantelleriensis TaxID=48727 RepID=A0A1G9JI57_9GAMM|nr:C45 family peptidase [Halomonas pantelleriensis]SDL37081.1 Predicted choloylglycine hydrolase [Halomonas pantelleriensis]
MNKQLEFRSVAEAQPGAKWQALFELHWPAYEGWYLSESERERPGYLACYNALSRHMPELLPTYERLCELAGGGDLAARMLSLYRPPAYITGCSQAVLANAHANLLVRNYDYPPELCEGTILSSCWNGRRVIAMSDCLWGVLDGINEQGLTVSLAFGGRTTVGDGFGAPIILRYILEFCTTTPEAVEVLARVPTHMAYNITVSDARGRYVTAMISPDRPASIRRVPVATNHQKKIEWYAHALASETLIRERQLSILVADEATTEQRLVSAFFAPPLFRRDYRRGLGTIYTAVYHPKEGRASFFWPGASLTMSFAEPREQQLTIHYGSRATSTAESNRTGHHHE